MSYPPPFVDRQNVLDAEHLRLLAIFHYIAGGFIILISSLFIFHTVMGLFMVGQMKKTAGRLDLQSSHTPSAHSTPSAEAEPGEITTPREQDPNSESPGHPGGSRDPDFDISPFGNIGYVVAGLGAFMVISGWTLGTLVIVSGVSLHRRRRRIFSLAIAGFCCLFFPFGTALGVFTFIVLLRPSVERLYFSAGSTVPASLPA